MTRIRKVLANRNFFLLWLAQLISQFGDRLNQMALVGLIYKKAPGSAFELAKLFLFVIIPVFLIGPIAGAYSDRWNKKYTMAVCDSIRGALVLLIVAYIALVPAPQPILPIYVLVFLVFSFGRFFLPAKMSIIPDLVHEKDLLLANSLVNITGMIAAVLGLGIGGLIISLPKIGVRGGFLIDAGTFFMSSILIFSMSAKQPVSAIGKDLYAIGKEIGEKIKKSVFVDIKEGIMYIVKHKSLHFVIWTFFILWSAIGASYAVVIVFVQTALGTATRDLGLLAVFFGAGLLTGTLLYGKYGSLLSKTKAIFLSLILGGVIIVNFTIFVTAYPAFLVAAAIAFIFGISIAPISISANTIIHEIIEHELRGRVFSSLEAVMHLAFLIFMLTSSIVADLINGSWVLIAVGFSCAYLGYMGFKKV
ncbi:MAG TPA: MFS transporter [Candidatus Omnitrophica bacterium]|nr:MFS transporter [Candidatus Omnitrophota bacterium]